MGPVPLDAATDTQIRQLIVAARRNGLDAIEVLHAHGLILSPARRHIVVMAALQDVLREMESWSPAEYLRRVNKTDAPTPKQMYDAILGYLADYVDHEAKKE